jgi:hypothetical protein
MICPINNHPTSRLIIRNGRKACAGHWGLSESGGTKIDGALTRSSDRVLQQQHTNEGDLIMPHTFNASMNRWEPNPDFIDRYAEQLPNYFTQDELEGAGYSKAGKIYEHRDKKLAAHDAEAADVDYVEDEQASSEFIESVASQDD